MASREQVRKLLDEGHSYETAARELGIPAGLAYMIATGRRADGGPPGFGETPANPQRFVNPPPLNPTENAEVLAWVRERAARELEGRAA